MIVSRMPWGPHELADWVEGRLRTGTGGWSAGVPGAIAEWAADRDIPTVGRDGTVVVATTPRGAIRMDTAGIVAFAVSFRLRPRRVRSIVLAMRRPEATRVARQGISYLGPDLAALDPDAVGDPLWDLGLGRPACHFQVRTTHAALSAVLRSTAGRPWTQLVTVAGTVLIDAVPHRVVDTPAARIEVYTPIPATGGHSPDGPHTHLLARPLASGRDLPRGVELPDRWTPVATHHL